MFSLEIAEQEVRSSLHFLPRKFNRLSFVITIVDWRILECFGGQIDGCDEIIAIIKQEKRQFFKEHRRLYAQMMKQLKLFKQGVMEVDDEFLPSRLFFSIVAMVSRIRFAEQHLGGSEFSEAVLQETVEAELPQLWSESRRAPNTGIGWFDQRRHCLSHAIFGKWVGRPNVPAKVLRHLGRCEQCRTVWQGQLAMSEYFRKHRKAVQRINMEVGNRCPTLQYLKDYYHLQLPTVEHKLLRSHVDGCPYCQHLLGLYRRRLDVQYKNKDLE